ncbi:hypothetical protein C5167_041320 [Papaver somniferum]|uniref:Peptidase A1 domain-containing protein n=1 Tax=Papaver somniferum TaxID=3469 RepID=A0A4Y7IHI3_PAPSO|nr:hypothetical protein C5167_041320 [Papaver somniferum]
MASSFSSHIDFVLLLLVYFSLSNAQLMRIIFDLERDPSTLQYMIIINQGTPLVQKNIVVDLGGHLPWLSCHKGYNSSLHRPVSCTSPQCSQVNGPGSRCVLNPVTRFIRKGELISDLVTVTSNPDSQVTVDASTRRLAFGCATTGNILSGLAKGAKGVAGLGLLTYTPLLINPKSKEEYFVDVKSIEVHGETVPINKNLLSINKITGVGGTKIDILIPYTTVETSIYKAFTKAYTRWAERFKNANAEVHDFPSITMVSPVAPFTTCFNSSAVPPVTMFLNNKPPRVAFIFPKSVWNISLFDLVRVNDGVDCVGFVDGGSKPKTSIVIGARQIGFLEFDISRSRLGFQEPNLSDE